MCYPNVRCYISRKMNLSERVLYNIWTDFLTKLYTMEFVRDFRYILYTEERDLGGVRSGWYL